MSYQAPTVTDYRPPMENKTWKKWKKTSYHRPQLQANLGDCERTTKTKNKIKIKQMRKMMKAAKLWKQRMMKRKMMMRTEAKRMLHTQNVWKLKETLDPSGKDNDIECLVKDGGSFIWRGWAKPVLDSKERRPGIVKSYFCSVSKFLDFILDHTGNEVEGMPPISEESVKRAALVLPRVKSWGCSITKMYAADTWSKTLKDRQEAINPESVEDMMTTKAATEAISLLKKSQVQKVDEKEFVKIRDFCIARLQLENGQRPGPLESATLQEFQRSEQTKRGYIMHVAGHKNARFGPAPIYLSTNLHTNINAYIKNVRPLFADRNTQEVFVKSTDGTAFKEGKTGKRVTEWGQKPKTYTFPAQKCRKWLPLLCITRTIQTKEQYIA